MTYPKSISNIGFGIRNPGSLLLQHLQRQGFSCRKSCKPLNQSLRRFGVSDLRSRAEAVNEGIRI